MQTLQSDWLRDRTLSAISRTLLVY